MRSSAAAVGAALLLVAVSALAQAPVEEVPRRATPSLPVPGYAFDRPRLLTQQLLWGLAHGVRLLAVTCRSLDNGDSAALAYLEWSERYRERLRRATRDLARHYFGQEDASYEALSAMMNLKSILAYAAEDLAPACDSLPEALGAERYDLERFYDLHRDAARVERAEAIRALVKRCRGEGDSPGIDAAFAEWETVNAPLELSALDRLAGGSGDAAADARWRREIGQGAVLPAVPCGNLPALLSSPGYGLLQVFGSDDE